LATVAEPQKFCGPKEGAEGGAGWVLITTPDDGNEVQPDSIFTVKV
jgi:hypothetical protein